MATRNNKIIIKRSATPAKIPLTTDLDLGELAINTNDGKLYLKKNDGLESIVSFVDEAPVDAKLHARLDADWQEIEDPVVAAEASTDAHVAASNPHPQYLTPDGLPSTFVGWYTNNVNPLDNAFLTTFSDRPTDPESSVQAIGATQGDSVLLGQWLRATTFTSPFTWFETNTAFQVDLEATNSNVELYLQSWLLKANSTEVLLATTSPIQLLATRQTYTFNVNIPGPIVVETGDNVINRIYINKNSGGADPTVTLYMEGNNVSRAVTQTPVATYPAPHATSHESGGSDLITHDNLTGAGTNSHAQIDTHIADVTTNPHGVTAIQAGASPTLHASQHEVGGTDLINHDSLTNAQGFKSHGQIDTDISDLQSGKAALNGSATEAFAVESPATGDQAYPKADLDTLLVSKMDTTASVGTHPDVDLTGVVDGNLLEWQTDKFVVVNYKVELGGYSEKIGTANTIDASLVNTNTISDGTTAVVISNVPVGAYTVTMILASGVSSINLTGLSIKWAGGAAPTWTSDEDLIFLTTINQGTSYIGSSSLGHV